MTVRQMTQTHKGKTIAPKEALVLTFARAALQDSFETMLGFRVGESAIPIVQRANAERLEKSATENAKVENARGAIKALETTDEFFAAQEACKALGIDWLNAPSLDDLFPASKIITEVTIYEATEERIQAGFEAPVGGMFGGDDIAECFKLAKESELPKLKGVLLASVTDGVGSLTIPLKRRGRKATASGPRAPKFTVKDYARLAGYGDRPDKDGNLPPHKGFVISVERDQRTKEQKKKGSGIDPIITVFTHELTIDKLKDSGKVCMNIYTTRSDGVKVPTVRFTEGRKKDLLVTEDLVEISPVSKLYGREIGHTGGRTPATEWDLPARLAEIDASEEKVTKASANVSASDLLAKALPADA